MAERHHKKGIKTPLYLQTKEHSDGTEKQVTLREND